jgi:hypothetical protein
MNEYKRALIEVGKMVDPDPEALAKVIHRKDGPPTSQRVLAAALGLLVAGVGFFGLWQAFGRGQVKASNPCRDLIPHCDMERLPDRTLIGEEHFGLLGPVDDDPTGIITFDDALIRAWADDPHAAAQAVEVILGSADGPALRWGVGTLFYAIVWHGDCTGPIGGRRGRPSFACPEDSATTTIIDAFDGDFVVSG